MFRVYGNDNVICPLQTSEEKYKREIAALKKKNNELKSDLVGMMIQCQNLLIENAMLKNQILGNNAEKIMKDNIDENVVS